ncbi:restriction endonuclease subunit S [Plebeiibacterium sediminum]|uniref:Restriction endonuclease subunit S n=1 Tax=Plebeiibacterium sediminum TaxID=2992112 RepID=A0AAE3M206_9BACT|nr:restriction endonuclease subunit S [Plebeiobacterium sediminum]MCW3785496.1 restriction endonuclease subunit S [Plebeiobacterium sediminum]
MEAVTEIKEGYKKTKIGWIPEDWNVGLLGEVTTLKRGRFSPRPRNDPKYYNGQIPFVQTGDVTNSKGRVNTYTQTLNEEGLKVSVLFKKGTILITIAANIGHCSILEFDMACPDSLIGIECGSKIHNEFLNYYMHTQQRRIDYLAPAGAQKNINVEFLKPLKIVVPPLPEQQKIAKILSTWDKAIEQSQKLIEQLNSRKKGLMQQLLTGKTRLKGFSGEWKEVKLGEYFKQRNETNHIELPLLSVGINGVYPQDDSVKKDTSNSDKSKYKRICVGDIGYNTMRMWQGRSALSKLEGIVSPAYTIVTPNKNADSLFFSYLFKLDYVVHRFYRYSQGLVSDTWQCRFNDFKKVKVLCPPTIEEQQAIAKVLTTADNEIKTQETYLQQLQDQKKGLMQQLLTGQKRVKVNN